MEKGLVIPEHKDVDKRFRSVAKTAHRQKRTAKFAAIRAANRAAGLTSDGRVKTF